MTRKMRADKKIYIASALMLGVLTLIASVSKLFTGFDIDEGYAVAMPWRMLMGDRLFSQMWEIHQTSSFLPALLMWPYIRLTGSTDGIVLYLRLVSLIIHLIFSVCIWHMTGRLLPEASGDRMFSDEAAEEKSGHDTGFDKVTYVRFGQLMAACIYFNLLPKWMQSVDFSMQQMWGITLVILCLYRERGCFRPVRSFFTGIALSVTVLGYVGMIVLYPALLIIYLKDAEKSTRDRLLSCCMMTLGCVFMAAIFFIYCIPVRGVSVSEFLSNIPNIFMDGTHTLGFSDKLLLYARQWSVVLKHGIIFLAASLLCMTAVGLSLRLTGKTEKNDAPKKHDASGVFTELLIWVMLISSVLMIVSPFAGVKLGPFHFQSRLLIIFLLMLAAMLSGKRGSGKNGTANFMLFAVMTLTLFSFAGILLFSNVGPDSSSSYLTPGLAAGVLWVYHRISCGAVYGKSTGRRDFTGRLFAAAALSFVLSLLMCKGFYVRYTEYFPSDITQQRTVIREGALAGIYVLPEDAKELMHAAEMIKSKTKAAQKAMLLGTDQILDLEMECRTVCPSTISTPAFNEQWITYFDKYPELLPDVVFIAKNTIDDRDKFFAKNAFGRYLAQRYDTDNMEENDAAVCIVRSGSAVKHTESSNP